MKIIHFISGGDTGGAKTHVLTLLNNLRKLDIEVELLCIMRGIFTEEAEQLGIKVTVIPQEKRWDVSVIKKIKDYINKSGADLVHCHGARANYIAFFIMKDINIPMLTTLHSDYRLDFKDNLRKRLIYTPINGIALRRFKHILAVTKAFKNMLCKRGFKENRIDVVYNGIEFEEKLDFYTKEEFYNKIGVAYDQRKIYVGIAARLYEVKGVDVFLKAAKLAYEKNKDLRFVVLGDGDMRKTCEDYIKENGLSSVVKMAGQVQDPVLMNSYYKYIDINMLTSHSESFPYALLEGARCSAATIATRVGGIPEMIYSGHDGFLAEDNDCKQLSEYILALAEDEEKRKEIGANFNQKAEKLFSALAMAKTHKEIYTKIIQGEKQK
ncbi:MAG: glycosyltransferase family 4 protein [Firmicutes bacterium]|nr:glycosyltransferase family 4 protein [Bacillota bacterium]